MREKVINAIREYNLIKEGENIVLGLSGGPDSMALLYILNELKKDIGFSLHAAHVNHQIRGEDADNDENYVRKSCERLFIPFHLKSVDVESFAKENGLTDEEAGREIRYGFFREILKGLGGGKIAVAHNKNDQAETLIMRFMRGTGIDGLKGMDYINQDIIRPLLGVKRDEIEKFCTYNDINPRIDKTNLEPIYGRNKVRLEMIPYMEENFNSGLIDTLFRTSRVIGRDSDFLNSYAIRVYKDIVKLEEENKVSLNLKDLRNLDEVIESRVLRYAIERINKHLQGIEEKHIKKIIDLIRIGATGKMLNISNNLLVKTSYDSLVIIKGENKRSIGDLKSKVKLSESTFIEELNSTVTAKVVDSDNFNLDFSNRFTKYFDYDKVKGDLYIRTRRDGDRFVPLGMKGSKKLKDYFIDEKIPRDKRDYVPLIEDEHNILWIVGYRISELFKITSDTKRILVIEYRILGEE